VALETDYLIVGAGAAGLAFADTLVTETDDEIAIVDRRAAPGGHWNDAYGFVRLHQPSLYYGVNSLPLGGDARNIDGPDVGFYERATGAEIRSYYDRVLHERLLPSGRVTFLPQSTYEGGSSVVSTISGKAIDVSVRKKIVDARYLSPSIPALTRPPFDVSEDARVVPVNHLSSLDEMPERFTIVGAGKTAMDACIWLLTNGIEPGRIQWIKPRESWLLNREFAQPADLVGRLFEGIALQMEAAAHAVSVNDLFDRLEAFGQVLRVDREVAPTMFKGATIAAWEIDLLRQIKDVVRLGRIRAIECDRIVLNEGSVPTDTGCLHVHCAADGLRRPPAVAIFGPDRITLQPVRTGLVPFNAALVAFVEAHRDDDGEKNRLCPPNPFPNAPIDWVRGTLIQMAADRAWAREPDIAAWLDRSRLNPTRGLRARLARAGLEQASQRFNAHVRTAITRLSELAAGDGGM
jgi:hypothetical protein